MPTYEANKFRPNPARPLVAYFIMNFVVAGLLALLVFGWGPGAVAQLHPVEIVIKAAPGVRTDDITAAIGSLGRRDVHVRSFEELSRQLPAGTWPLAGVLVLFSFFLTGPFYFIYCIAYWLVSRFD